QRSHRAVVLQGTEHWVGEIQEIEVGAHRVAGRGARECGGLTERAELSAEGEAVARRRLERIRVGEGRQRDRALGRGAAGVGIAAVVRLERWIRTKAAAIRIARAAPVLTVAVRREAKRSLTAPEARGAEARRPNAAVWPGKWPVPGTRVHRRPRLSR